MSSAVIGIAMSLIPLNVVLVVTNGMIAGITERFMEIGTGHLQIRAFNRVDQKELEQVRDVLAATDGVRLYRLTCQGNGLLYSGGRRSGIHVKAFPEDIYETDDGFRKYLEVSEGVFDLASPDAIMLSAEVAKTLRVHPGDEVTLLVSANPGGRGVIIRPARFIVQGVFSTGYYELDSLTAYIPLETGRNLFRNPGSLYYGVKVADPFGDIDSLAVDIQYRLPQGWFTYTWYELERPMYETFRTTRNILLFIMLLILLVASVNISSSLVMLVLEKEHDIAILKSAGTSPGTIAASFITTGFFLGVAGTLTGMSIGLALAVNINDIIRFLESTSRDIGMFLNNIHGIMESRESTGVKILDPSFYLEEIPVKVRFWEVWLISMFSILCATLAAYIPSRRAGNIRPLEIIQKH